MMKHWMRVGLCAAAMILASTAGRAADKVTFQLGWIPTGDIAAVYVGQTTGIYEKAGLDVTVMTGRGSLDAVTRVATGVSDIGAVGLGALLQAAAEAKTPVPVKQVMSQYTKMPDSLMTWKGSRVKSFKDVAGKTVGTATFSISNAYWPTVLSSSGIDPASVKLIKTDVNALAPLLAQGQVDATINWAASAPGIASVLKAAGKELVVLPWSDIGFEGYGYGIIASDAMIKGRPDVVRRFVAAYKQVIAAALKNPSLVGAAVKAKVPEADADTISAQFRASIPLIENAISDKDGFGALEPKLVQATWVWLAKAQNYPPDRLAPEAYVDREFLK